MRRCFPCLTTRPDSVPVFDSKAGDISDRGHPESTKGNVLITSNVEGSESNQSVPPSKSAVVTPIQVSSDPITIETQPMPNILFPYPPLQLVEGEFRLLVIKSGQEHEDVQCTLSNAIHSDYPVYSALSYCWGSMSILRTVYINDHAFEVGSNCEAAIRMLRQKDIDVTVWIDSICIDQNSKEDRNRQVRQMRRKYENARDVVVWLGVGEAYTKEAVEILEAVSQMGRYNPALSSKTVGTESQWAAVRKFFKIPWFERIWVVQEVALAKAISIRVGTHVITWPSFVKAIQWYLEDIDYVYKSMLESDSLFNNACAIREAWARRAFVEGNADRIEFLLGVFSHWKATCMSDKVYGLLGLSKEHDAEELLVDYDLPIAQIFSKVVRFVIAQDGRLDILAQCHNPPIFQGLPSWIPDWTTDRVYRQPLSEIYRTPGSAKILFQPADDTHTDQYLIPTNLPIPRIGYGTWEQDAAIPLEMNFSATLDTTAHFNFPKEENLPRFRCLQGTNPSAETIIVLKGTVVGVIESVSRPMFRVREDVDDPKFMLAWEEFALLSPLPDGVKCPYGGTFEDRLEAYWRTLITDRIHQSRGNIPAPKLCSQLFEEWRSNMIKNADPANEVAPVTVDTVDLADATSSAQLKYNDLASTSLTKMQQSREMNAFFLDIFSSANADITPAQLEKYNRLFNRPDTVFHEEYEAWKERVTPPAESLEQRVESPNLEHHVEVAPTTSLSNLQGLHLLLPKSTNHTSDPSDTPQPVITHLYPGPPDLKFPQNEVNVRSFEASIRHWGFARKLARTTKGHLALVPEHTGPGDRIILLYGGSVPYISRPNQKRGVLESIIHDVEGRYGDPGERYEKWQHIEKFVGEAYVHGIMNGESMTAVREDGKRENEQEFWFE